ncbi:hypothetical protein UABHE_004200 [Candidatus Uabimicrobium helgolandensis]
MRYTKFWTIPEVNRALEKIVSLGKISKATENVNYFINEATYLLPCRKFKDWLRELSQKTKYLWMNIYSLAPIKNDCKKCKTIVS